MTAFASKLIAAAGAATLLLAGCGGGDDTSNTSNVAGCTGKVAAFFELAKGSYTAPASTFDNNSFTTIPASVAGFANGANQTVTVSNDCTMTVGTVKMTYKDGSYAEFPGTGVDAGKTQYDVDMTGSGVATPHMERFTSGKRGVSLFDTTKTNQGVRFDEL
jgi:hypothetical protein